MQELDPEGLALDIVDDGSAWNGCIELEIVVDETAIDWEELVEDERSEKDKACFAMDSLVELVWAAALWDAVDATADCK